MQMTIIEEYVANRPRGGTLNEEINQDLNVVVNGAQQVLKSVRYGSVKSLIWGKICHGELR